MRGRTTDGWTLAGHEATQTVPRVRDSGRTRVRYADTQTRRRDCTAGHECTRAGGVAGEPKASIWAVYVQDRDDEADAAVVCAERGGGDQVAECGAGADSEEDRRRGCSWGSGRKSGLEAGGGGASGSGLRHKVRNLSISGD